MDAQIPAANAARSRTDDQLLTAARQGDAGALETLLVRYQPQLYRFGLRMCGNVDDAGDVAQDSLIAMARSLRDFRGDASVSTWLYTIARRFCIRKRRRSKFAPARVEPLDAPGNDAVQHLVDPAPNPEHAAAGGEIEAALAAAIDALDERQREVLVLRDIEGLSAPEVAKVMRISVDAVKSRLHRARVAVRNQLAPRLGGPAAEAPRSPQCPDLPKLFSRYLEGEISPAVCAKMETHLAQCDRCRAACENLKRTLALCRQLPAPEMPVSVASSVRSAVRAFLTSHRAGRG
jgi:RNA polymerase sigma-70 factor (ECF subfamily)